MLGQSMMEGFASDLGEVLIASLNPSSLAIYEMWPYRGALRTHAVQPPCVFELVFSPDSSNRGSLFMAKVSCQFLRYAFGREQRAV